LSAALGRSDGRLGAAGCSRPEAPCMRQGSVRPHCVHLAWIRIKLATCLPPTGQQLPGVQGGDAAAHQVRCARCGLLPLCTPWPTHAAPAPAVHWCAGLLQPVPVAPRFLLRQRLGPCSDAPPTSRLSTLPSCVCLLAQEAGLQRNPDHGHPGAGGQGAHPPTLCSDMPWPRSRLCCRRRRLRCWSCLQHTHPIPTAGLFLFRRSTPTTAPLATTSPTSSACPPAAAPPTS